MKDNSLRKTASRSFTVNGADGLFCKLNIRRVGQETDYRTRQVNAEMPVKLNDDMSVYNWL